MIVQFRVFPVSVLVLVAKYIKQQHLELEILAKLGIVAALTFVLYIRSNLQ